MTLHSNAFTKSFSDFICIFLLHSIIKTMAKHILKLAKNVFLPRDNFIGFEFLNNTNDLKYHESIQSCDKYIYL